MTDDYDEQRLEAARKVVTTHAVVAPIEKRLRRTDALTVAAQVFGVAFLVLAAWAHGLAVVAIVLAAQGLGIGFGLVLAGMRDRRRAFKMLADTSEAAELELRLHESDTE